MKPMPLLRRILAVFLALVLMIGPVSGFASGKTVNAPLSARDAVSDMRWGVNLMDMFIANVDNSQGNPVGYYDHAPFGIAFWFWNYGFDWLDPIGPHSGTYTAEVPIPDYNGHDQITDWVGGLFHIGIMSYTYGQRIKLSFSDSQIVKSDGSVISLAFLDGEYDSTANNGPDQNGFCHFAINFDKSKLPKPGFDLDGAVFRTNITVKDVPFMSPQAKADYFYQLQRIKLDTRDLVDLFMEQGVNVFRIPITWTSFIHDETFEIDECWLQAVQKDIDYILNSGAYCTINMHNDYSIRSYVGDHWEENWMYPQYASYVNSRFQAVWTQIAEYFKDYSDHLIFEPFNEPSMAWYDTCPDDHYPMQLSRINELNQIFVDAVRSTGGKNKTRLLCLAVGNYNTYPCLTDLLPPKDDYLIAQVHSYSEMEINDLSSVDPNYDYRTKTDALFDAVDAFMAKTGIPVLIGEVGATHKQSDAVQAQKVAYYFQRAKQSGVPCLWWEDSFYMPTGFQYWLYDKNAQSWGRPLTLQAIRQAVQAPSLCVKVTLGEYHHWLSSAYTGACTVYAALYDGNGKLVQVKAAYRLQDQRSVRFTFSADQIPDDHELRVFLLGDQNQPLSHCLTTS